MSLKLIKALLILCLGLMVYDQYSQIIYQKSGIDFYITTIPARMMFLKGPVRQIYDNKEIDNILISNLNRDMGSKDIMLSTAAKYWIGTISDYSFKGVNTFTGSPLFYAFISNFVGKSYSSSLFRYNWFSCILMAVALLAILRFLDFAWIDSVLIVCLCMYVYLPIQFDVKLANVNRLQFFGLAILLLTSKISNTFWRYFSLAFFSAMLILFKPNFYLVTIGSFAACLASMNRRILFSYFSGVVLAALLVGLYTIYKFDTLLVWQSWLSNILEIDKFQYIASHPGNFNLATYLPTSVRQILSFSCISLFILTLILLVRRFSTQLSTQIINFSIIGGLAVNSITNLVMWYHYFTLTLFLLFFLIHDLKSINNKKAGFVLLLSVFTFLFAPHLPDKNIASTIVVMVNLVFVCLYFYAQRFKFFNHKEY